MNGDDLNLYKNLKFNINKIDLRLQLLNILFGVSKLSENEESEIIEHVHYNLTLQDNEKVLKSVENEIKNCNILDIQVKKFMKIYKIQINDVDNEEIILEKDIKSSNMIFCLYLIY